MKRIPSYFYFITFSPYYKINNRPVKEKPIAGTVFAEDQAQATYKACREARAILRRRKREHVMKYVEHVITKRQQGIYLPVKTNNQ